MLKSMMLVIWWNLNEMFYCDGCLSIVESGTDKCEQLYKLYSYLHYMKKIKENLKTTHYVELNI